FALQNTTNYSGKNSVNFSKTLTANNITLDASYSNITLSTEDRVALQELNNLHVLCLNNNNISVIPNDTFITLSQLQELNLANNSISKIEMNAFDGLSNLTILYLCHNKISNLDPGVFKFLKNLRALKLHNNNLKSLSFDSEMFPKLTTITLSGNPWNCNCDLFTLQLWLNTSQVGLQNDDKTKCDSPEKEKGQLIHKASLTNCYSGQLLTLFGCVSISRQCNPSFHLLFHKDSQNSKTHVTPERPSKSWHFLMGVVLVTLTITLLIIFRMKCPVWYKSFFSYQHQRLKEDKLENEFNTNELNIDLHSFFSIGEEEEESAVQHEQDDNGYIEDKYIDGPEFRDGE
uniref:Leucine rich repeat containing 19 n=1 Tax=Latimeria chalumnae TaxID=7897 RepID=H3AX16_LATCH